MKKVFIAAVLVLIPFLISAQDYKLMWEDNFDHPVLNETDHWTVEVNGNGGGNNELQYYRSENISIEQHPSGVNCLVISAKRENFGGKVATSGRLVTRRNVSAKYGKMEARIKLPQTANGLWPAFWMMGEDYSTVGWPRCGEIDILEMGNVNGISRGTQDKYFNGACHWGENWTYYAKDNTAAYSLQDDFHLFTMIWDETTIKMYLDLDKYPDNAPYFEMKIDGQRVAGQVSYYFHKPFSFLFNLAVGGNFTGITGNTNISKITALPVDGTPVKMYIDYVRIYQKGVAGEEFYGPSNIVDDEIPTSFTASKGAVTSKTVELLLNATDKSGEIVYYITYGSSSLTVRGLSGIQKPYIIDGLNPSTNYSFSIVAKDLKGNAAANNPVVVLATTGEAVSLATIDYETVGHNWAWTLFENGDNAPALYSVVANPSITGINTSATVAKYIVNSNGASWAGIWSDNMPEITFDASNCIVKVLVYKSVASSFDVKFEGDGGLNFEKLVPNTKINQWEELTFDFSNKIGSTVKRLVIIPDFPTTRTVGSTNYWDNISFNSNAPSGLHKPIDNNISLFPNPFRDKLKISSDKEISHVVVRNLMGQALITIHLHSRENELDLSRISSGNYLITVMLADGNLSTLILAKL
jgi:beta-glucanase (GH16 family)